MLNNAKINRKISISETSRRTPLLMIIKTKKYRIPRNLYIKLGIVNVLRMQWWVLPLSAAIMSATLFTQKTWFLWIGIISLVVYFLFWLIQFYGVTHLGEGRLMFERVFYEISSQRCLLQVNPKQGFSIPWNNVVRVVKGKGHFLLILSKVQFFYLPFKIFNSSNEINFLTVILRRKGLLRGMNKVKW